MKTLLKSMLFLSVAFLFGCQSAQQATVSVSDAPAQEKTAQKPQKTAKPEAKQANIIGAVEPIYILPMKSAFEARIDTGATTSSLDADDIREFERDGEKWVSFKIVNRRSGEEHHYEKRVVKSIRIKRIKEKEDRVKVSMSVRFGGEEFTSEFTLAKRDDFEYQALIGRNILSGRAIVDTSLSHTLK